MTFDDISGISILLPLCVGLITLKRQNKTLIKLSVLIFFTITFQPLVFYLAYKGTNNLWLFHLHTYVEIVILAWIFLDILHSWRKHVVRVLLGGFLLFSLINVLKLEDLSEFNSNQRYIAGIFMIICVLMYYFQLFKEAEVRKLERDPYFILNSSLLLYFTGTLFLFIFGKYVMNTVNTSYWNLHSAFNILLNIGYTLTLWMGVKKLT